MSIGALNISTEKQAAAKIPEVPLTRLDTLWMQVGGTLCNLSCTHCFISCGPKNNSHSMMTLAQVRKYLEESRRLGVKDYYITGGEVFLNPEIFDIYEAILEYGPCHSLTNGTLITREKAKRLVEIQSRSERRLHFRISIESHDEAENDKIRGKNSYRLALKGLRNLAEAGFSPILAVTRSWDEANDAAMEAQLLDLLKQNNVTHPKVKILPGFLIGRLSETDRPYSEDERVTEQCFENYPVTNLQCSSSRMASAKGVYVCPILIEDNMGRMGDSIEETLRPYPLAHSACYTCRVSGMTCKS